MVASPARMHTNGSGRRPSFGAVVSADGHLHQRRRHALLHRADHTVALVGPVQVAFDPSQRFGEGRSTDRVQREVAADGAVERGRDPQRTGRWWRGAVTVELGVGTERPVAHRLHDLAPGQLEAVVDEHRFVAPEQVTASVAGGVGEQVDVVGTELAGRPRLGGGGHRRDGVAATQDAPRRARGDRRGAREACPWRLGSVATPDRATVPAVGAAGDLGVEPVPQPDHGDEFVVELAVGERVEVDIGGGRRRLR